MHHQVWLHQLLSVTQSNSGLVLFVTINLLLTEASGGSRDLEPPQIQLRSGDQEVTMGGTWGILQALIPFYFLKEITSGDTTHVRKPKW